MTDAETIPDRVIRHILDASDEQVSAEDVRPETSLRDDLDPGLPGRPLEKIGRKFWRIPPGYPANDKD